MKINVSATLAIFALTACGGGALQGSGGSLVPSSSQSAPLQHDGLAPASDPGPRMHGGPKRGIRTSAVHFYLTVPPKASQHHRSRPQRSLHPSFVPASSESVVITLATVNGGAPPAGLTLKAETDLTNCASGCNVNGPAAPIGTDTFTITIFDQTGGTGHALATGGASVNVVPATSNTGSAVLQGVPSTFVLVGSTPAGAGGTAFSSPKSLAVNVEDAAGDVISGTYAQAVTVTDTDVASTTLASGLTLGADCSAPVSSVQLSGDTDAAALSLCYGGLDIVPAPIRAKTSLTAAVTVATFSPTVPSVTYTGPTPFGSPEIDLYVANGPAAGTGSFGSWTASQAGWTNGPYGKTITETDNCSTISNFAGSNKGTGWNANAIAIPVVGSCTMTMHGGAGATKGVLVTYTETGIGITQKPHPTP